MATFNFGNFQLLIHQKCRFFIINTEWKKAKKKNRISNNKNISIAWMFRPKMGPIFVSSTFPHFISADYMKKGKGISFQDFATISNVWVSKKDTNRSSNTLLRLVSFFATQTLPDNLALFWQLLSTTAVHRKMVTSTTAVVEVTIFLSGGFTIYIWSFAWLKIRNKI